MYGRRLKRRELTITLNLNYKEKRQSVRSKIKSDLGTSFVYSQMTVGILPHGKYNTIQKQP